MIKRTFYGLVSAAATVAILSACSIESANDVIRQVNVNVAGVYRNNDSSRNGGRFVSVNSGSQVTFLDVRQTGNQLEAIDNNAIIFRGTVGDPRDNQAQFNIEGRTTAGNRALISGTISIGDGRGIMSATWIEDNLVGTVYGVANGPSISTNQPPPTNNVPTNGTNDVNIDFPFGQNTIDEINAYKKLAWWFCDADSSGHDA